MTRSVEGPWTKHPRAAARAGAARRRSALRRRADLESLEARIVLSETNIVFNSHTQTIDIDSSTPVEIPVENTKAGQTIPLVLNFSTTDDTTPEDTENEWVEIQGSDGNQMTVMDYGKQTIEFPITQNGEKITAWIDGADGDESGTITAGDREIKVDVDLKELSAPFQGLIDDVIEADNEIESILKYAPGWKFYPPKPDPLEVTGKFLGEVDIGPDGSIDGGEVGLEGSVEGSVTTELFWGLPFKIAGLSASLTGALGLSLGVTASYHNGVSEFEGELKPEGSLKLAGNVYLAALKGSVYGKGTLELPITLNTDGEGTGKLNVVGEVGGELDYADGSKDTISREFGPKTLTEFTFSGEDLFNAAIAIAEAAAEADPLVVTTQPPAAVAAGQPFGMVVTATNADGSVNTGFNGPVTVSDPGQSGLAGRTTVNAVHGVATFTGLTLTGASTGAVHQLYVSSASGSVYSGVVRVTSATAAAVALSSPSPAAPTVSQFAFTGRVGSIPASWEGGTPIVVPGAPFSVTVRAEDANGNLLTGYNGPVSLALAKNPSAAHLGGNLTVNAVNGVATFTGLTIDKEGRGFVLTTTGPAATPGASNTFDVLDYLAITTPAPSSIVAGTPFGLVVQAQDASGHLDHTFNGNVTISESNYSGGATDLLQGALTVKAVDGVATFAGLTLDQTGRYSVLISGNDVVFTSQLFQVTPGPVTQLAVTTQPLGTVTASVPFGVVVKAEDALGNVNPGAVGNVTLALDSNPGGASLNGTSTVGFSGGVASFSNLSLDKPGSGYTLKATTPGAAAATTTAFGVTPAGVATRLVITTPPPGSHTAGTSFGLVVKAEDGAGTVDTSYGGPVTLTLGRNTTGATLGGTLTVTASSGVATFAGLSLDTVGSYTIVASGAGLAPATTASLGVAAASASQTVVASPSGGVLTGARFATTVRIEDAFGNLVSVSQPVVLALAANPGGATLGGTLALNAVNGVATFSSLTLDKPGSGYTLKATSSTLAAGVSPAFDVTTDRLTVTASPPTGVAAGSPFGLVVHAVGPGGAVDTTFNGPVTLGLIDYDGTGATLSGTLTLAASGGVATFTGLSLNHVGTYALTATAGGAAPVTTGAFDVAASRLAISAQPPALVTATAPFGLTVTAGDAAGNVDPTYNGPVTLALASNPAGATLGGTLTVNAVNGVATFLDVTLDKPGGGVTLTATAAGLTSDTSGAVAVVPAGIATHLVVTAAPPDTLTAGTPFGLTVKAEDTFGNVIGSFHGAVTVADAQGTLTGPLTVTASSGVATFAGLTLDQAWPFDPLTVTAPGLISATTDAIVVEPAAATQLIVSAPSVPALTGAPFDIEVVAEDPFGNIDPTYQGSITLKLGTNPGGASLGGTLTSTATGGVASFPGLSISRSGDGYTLAASGAGGISGIGPGFDVTADRLVFTTQPSGNVTAGTPFDVVVVAEDATGKIDPTFNASVMVSAPSLAQNLGGTTTVTAVHGVATFSGLTLNLAGVSGGTLVAVSGDLPAAETGPLAVIPGAATRLALIAAPPVSVSTGAPFEVVIAAQDSAGNVLSTFHGNVTLVLANPQGAHLGGTLTAAAVNGVAAFPGLTLDQVGSGYILAASAPGLTAVATTAVHVAPVGVATRLVVTAQPTGSLAAGSLFGLVVKAEDSAGNVDSSFQGIVTVSDPAGVNLVGTTTVTAVGGVATFHALSLTQAGPGTILLATGAGLVAGTTSPFDVTALPATRLVAQTFGGNALAGSRFATAVYAEDRYGNVDLNFNGTVTLALAKNPAGASLMGPVAAPATGGAAFFLGLSIDRPGSGYSIEAQAAGLPTSTSTPFAVTTDQLAVTVQPLGSVPAGVSFGLTVAAEDAAGNIDKSFSGDVTVSLLNFGPGSPTLAGNQTVKAVNGVATFSGLTTTQPATFVLTVTAAGVGGTASNLVTTNSGSAPPSPVTVGPAGPVVAGAVFVDAGSFMAVGAGPFHAAVNYGDGTGLQPLALAGNGTFVLSHTYALPGSYTLIVGVAGPSGVVGITTLNITVTAAPHLSSGFGAGRDAFVTTLYLEDLGRFPEPSGLQFWSRVLAAGGKPKTVALAIWGAALRLGLVNQGPFPTVTFQRSYADALLAGQLAARFHIAPPAGSLALTLIKRSSFLSSKR